MGEGEVAIAVVCTLVAAVGWIALFVSSGGVSAAVAGKDGGRAKSILALAPICTLLIVSAVLLTISASDVRNDPRYLWLYGAMGLAVVRLALGLPSPATISPSHDAVQGRNTAAAWTYVATAAGYALAFAGANVGDGPGFEVVIFSFLLSCGTLYLFHAGLGLASGLATRVTSDRSAAAAWRLSALLIAAGAICGRATCGNWVSMAHTLSDFVATAWVLPVFIVIEGTAARVGSPRVEDGFARFAAMLTSAAYLLAAAGYIIFRGPW